MLISRNNLQVHSSNMHAPYQRLPKDHQTITRFERMVVAAKIQHDRELLESRNIIGFSIMTDSSPVKMHPRRNLQNTIIYSYAWLRCNSNNEPHPDDELVEYETLCPPIEIFSKQGCELKAYIDFVLKMYGLDIKKELHRVCDQGHENIESLSLLLKECPDMCTLLCLCCKHKLHNSEKAAAKVLFPLTSKRLFTLARFLYFYSSEIQAAFQRMGLPVPKVVERAAEWRWHSTVDTAEDLLNGQWWIAGEYQNPQAADASSVHTRDLSDDNEARERRQLLTGHGIINALFSATKVRKGQKRVCEYI
jgi:hypothetical protein